MAVVDAVAPAVVEVTEPVLGLEASSSIAAAPVVTTLPAVTTFGGNVLAAPSYTYAAATPTYLAPRTVMSAGFPSTSLIGTATTATAGYTYATPYSYPTIATPNLIPAAPFVQPAAEVVAAAPLVETAVAPAAETVVAAEVTEAVPVVQEFAAAPAATIAAAPVVTMAAPAYTAAPAFTYGTTTLGSVGSVYGSSYYLPTSATSLAYPGSTYYTTAPQVATSAAPAVAADAAAKAKDVQATPQEKKEPETTKPAKKVAKKNTKRVCC